MPTQAEVETGDVVNVGAVPAETTKLTTAVLVIAQETPVIVTS